MKFNHLSMILLNLVSRHVNNGEEISDKRLLDHDTMYIVKQKSWTYTDAVQCSWRVCDENTGKIMAEMILTMYP